MRLKTIRRLLRKRLRPAILFIGTSLGGTSLGLARPAFSEPLAPFLPQPSTSTVEVGGFNWLGAHCFNWDDTPLVLTPYRIHIPLRNWLKANSLGWSRNGLCQFTLSLKIPKDFRLALYGFSGQSVMSLAPKNSGRTRAQISLPDRTQLGWSDAQQAADRYQATLVPLQAETEIFSECGKDLVIQGQLETDLHGKGVSIAKIEQLAIDYELQACERTPPNEN